MSTLNGFGTRLLGNYEEFDDGSYISIEWIIVFYIPIYPIATFKIIDEEENTLPLWAIYAKAISRYRVVEIPMNWKYAWKTLKYVYSSLVSCIILFILIACFPQNLIVIFLSIIGIAIAIGVCLTGIINSYD
jgi:hypothetical protein